LKSSDLEHLSERELVELIDAAIEWIDGSAKALAMSHDHLLRKIPSEHLAELLKAKWAKEKTRRRRACDPNRPKIIVRQL
jgi:hypothetical protein